MTDPRAFLCAGRTPDGGSCPWSASCTIGTVPLCRHHRDLVIKEVGYTTGDGLAVVYYIGDPDAQLVKIGTSTALKKRLTTIRKTRPRALLLATEPGAYGVEAQRHSQFRAAQQISAAGEREWFRKTPLLMEHVAQLRSEHGVLCPGPALSSRWIAPVRAGAYLRRYR